jgi:hypothetical protein
VQSGIGTTTKQLAGDTVTTNSAPSHCSRHDDPDWLPCKMRVLRSQGHASMESWLPLAKNLKNVLLCRRSLLQQSAIANLWKYAKL